MNNILSGSRLAMNTAAIIGDVSSPKRDHTSVHDANRRSRYMKQICIAVDEKYALLLMLQIRVAFY